MYKLITKRENNMGTPASKQAKIKYFTEALVKAEIIKIDGELYNITAWFENELHFNNDEGECYVNTLEELVLDMHEIELLGLQRIWG